MSDLALALLAGAAGVVFATAILLIARRGNLSTRYTLGWLFVAACVVLSGLFAGAVDTVASWIGVSPDALVVTVVAAALLALTVQLSITVSGLTEIVRTLAESVAILEERIRRLERGGEQGSYVDGDGTRSK